MKKYLIAFLAAGFGVMACYQSDGPTGVADTPTFTPQFHTAGDPLIVDLLAGQTTDIGDVKVWNDVNNLYVQFVSTECMTETHLHVAESLSEIPQTKNGNPIPGQFEYQTEHGFLSGDDCVKSFTYTIPLNSWSPGTSLYIAAHASLGSLEAMTIVSDGNTRVTQRRSGNEIGFTALDQAAVFAWEPGPSYPNDGPDDSGWEANSLWDQRLSNENVNTDGADWIWETYRVADPVNGTVLTFQRTFDIGYPMAGNLLIACDNGYEAFLNGTSLGSDNVSGTWRTSNLHQSFVDVSGWETVGSFDLVSALIPGTNTLKIDAANEYFNSDDSGNPAAGTVSSNPGGCIYKATIDYLAEGETAWGDGNRFNDKNWSTYFTYTVQCAVEPGLTNGGFETPDVPAGSPGWDIYDSGTAGLGWTVKWHDGSTSYGGWTRPEPAHLELHNSGTVVPAHEANQYAELDTDWNGPSIGSLNNEPASVKISQELNTCPGQEYTLMYAWRGRPGRASSMDVNFADYSVSHSNMSGQWNTVSATATASSATTTLEFIETGNPDSFGMFLDNVRVAIKNP